MARIFVCYRREDTFHATGRLGDRLRARYGANNVFVDVNSNEAGVEYRRTTLAALRASDVVLVVIGDRWLGGRGFFPRARRGGIHSPQSLARFEIEAALRARIPIVPVLVDGARMPELQQLPGSIAGLSEIHARRLDAGEDFDHHTGRLIERIDAVVAEAAVKSGAVAERRVVNLPLADRTSPAFADSRPPADWPWEFPERSVGFAADPSEDAALPVAAEAAAPNTALPDADKKRRLWIAGLTAVLVLPLMVLGVALFFAREWKFLGLTNQSDDTLFSGIFAMSALIVAFIAVKCRRWNALDRVELASYWLAASAPVVLTFFVFFLIGKRSVFSLQDGSGTVIGGAIVLATGLFLLASHWNDWVERELPIYWLGCYASSLAVVIPIILSYLPQQADKISLLACSLELCVGGVLVWRQRRSLTLHDHVIVWVGAVALGALTSGLIFGVTGWKPLSISGPAGKHGLVLWSAVVALSTGYLIFRLGRRLSLWERALCGAIAAGFCCLGIAALPIASPANVTLGAVAGVIFLAIALLPITRKRVPKTVS